MKLVSTLVENFRGRRFTPGLMYFQYGLTLYPILEVTDQSVEYGELGNNRRIGSLSGRASYEITNIVVKNRLLGPRIVFGISN